MPKPGRDHTPRETAPTWRVELTATGGKRHLPPFHRTHRVRLRGDLADVWGSICDWMEIAKDSKKCLAATITLHPEDCDHS